MDESFNRIAESAEKSQEQATRLFEQLMKVAQPESVYSEAIASGDYTLITASEVTTGLGFGYGVGGGTGMVPASKEEGKESNKEAQGTGSGGGGGGAGRWLGRWR
jgi:uncharacterized spore protein YtfJ